jgi:hypothetical protein
MRPEHRTVYWRLAALMVAACAVSPVALPIGGGNDELTVGIVIGTVFQGAVLAGAWAVLGPSKTTYHLLFACLAAAMFGMSLELGIYFVYSDFEFRFIFFSSLICLLALVPFSLSRWLFHVRLRDQAVMPIDDMDAIRSHQFGIRQLMILTAVVGVLLGIGRVLISTDFFESTLRFGKEFRFFSFLAGSQVIVGVPLVFAVFVPNRWQLVIGATISLLLLVAATVMQASLSLQLMPSGNLSSLMLFTTINLTTSFWVVLFAVVVRSSGFHFGLPQSFVILAKALPAADNVPHTSAQ